MSWSRVGDTMKKIRETVYGLHPQTYNFETINLKNDKDILQGVFLIHLMTGQTKRINIHFDYKTDKLEISEVKK